GRCRVLRGPTLTGVPLPVRCAFPMQSEFRSPPLSLPLSSRARRATEQPISYLIALAVRDPNMINLAAGLVDPRTLPVDECDAIVRRIFADPARGRAA